MKTRSTVPIGRLILKIAVLTWLAASIPAARATQTIWSGPTTNFAQAASAPGDKDVLIPNILAIKRQSGSFLYNTFVEGGAGAGTPSDTEWAFGTMANHNSLSYKSFSQIHSDAQAAGQHLSTYLTSGPMVLHIINQDIYVSVTFTSWPRQNSTFSYTRSTPAAVPPTPSVTITNPVNGAVFADPANVTIAANATVSSGTVTNVIFLSNGTPIGSSQAAPFTFTANGLTAGNYALKAVATASGISATSSVVNISVISPPTVSVTITNPADGAVFADPANVTIAANATVSSGTITNVTFFSNSISIGSLQAPPFTITANGLTSGNYAFQAVATAAGISGTSSVVNISVAIPPTISVTITNPADGVVFAAPANITMSADATTSSGTVTNVTFLSNSTSIGSQQVPPFTITANGLTSGNYALKAVATAAGFSATSSVVNVSVVTPVATSLSTVPETLADNQFTFSYSATPGLRYEVDISSNLIDWIPFVTNVPQTNLVFITNNISGGGSYFRVGRVPNP